MYVVTRVRGGWTAVAGYAVIAAIGVALFAAHLLHAVGAEEDLWTFLYGIAVPMGFALALLAGLLWLVHQNFESREVWRVVGWVVAGGVVLGVGAFFIVLYQAAHGTTMHDTEYVVADAVSIGADLGLVLGIYDCRQRQARAAHATAKQRTDRLNRQLGVINRVLRHDIRNSANVIRGRAAHLKDGTGDTPNLDAIERRATKLVTLGEQARGVERVLRTDDTDHRTVDLCTVVRDRLAAVADAHGPIDSECSLPETARVRAHPMVGTAVENVLENAVVHNDADRPSVEVALTRTNAGDFELRIVDDGPGIPPQEVEVLERGYETQLEHTTGLGLWLVNWIVTESGGDVSFDPLEDGGSAVTLRLPAADASAGETI